MSKSSVVPYSPRQKKPVTQPAIDAVNDSVPPLDFSFYNLETVEDVLNEEPRLAIASLKKGETAPVTNKDAKSKSQCLRINNNQLTDIKQMCKVVSNLFENPATLGWIDLSYNELVTIDPVLGTFEQLKILYLHGNKIAQMQEVDKLAPLKSLWKLTLHGNPVEDVKGYKQYVLSVMPWLLCLDCVRITKADLKTADTWNKMCNKGTKKKKKQDAQ